MPHMMKLNKITEEAVCLFKWDGRRIIFIDEVYSKYIIRIKPDPGLFVPLFCTAPGKIALADMKEQALEQYMISTEIKKYTPCTEIDPKMIKHQLKMVNREGLAYDNEEFRTGYRSIAAGVRDVEEKLVGCVTLMGATSRLTSQAVKELAMSVKNCAMEISYALGYRAE